jgi:hypothetical protein
MGAAKASADKALRPATFPAIRQLKLVSSEKNDKSTAATRSD